MSEDSKHTIAMAVAFAIVAFSFGGCSMMLKKAGEHDRPLFKLEMKK